MYLPRNQKCPDDGDMNCYSTSKTREHFYCNSSDISIPASLGSVTCYRWFKTGMSTLQVLEQIGLCAGLIQVFNWLVNLYLRLLLFVAGFYNSKHVLIDSKPGFACLFCGLIIICVLPVGCGPTVALILLVDKKTAVTGLTMAVVSGALLVVIAMMFLFFIVHEDVTEKTKTNSNNTAASVSLEMGVITGKTQHRSTETNKGNRISPS
ncbi:unnamed protein product [Rotaria magnacalcarata]|uniref:Uncharacterized protein n=1 Tax=Rotaria magnacalcarata TaxID=392030 RepID=A0A816ZY62_9BILA|nr:unnamed protein product [Rotaria magnacalcarata]